MGIRKWFARHNLSRGLSFFAQMLIALSLITIFMGLSALIGGTIAFSRLEREVQETLTPVAMAWQSRLADFYASNGSWDDVAEFIEQTPIEEAPEADIAFSSRWITVASADGAIVYSPSASRIGSPLSAIEQRWALPVTHEQTTVGYVLFAVFTPVFEPDLAARGLYSGVFAGAFRRFMMIQAGIGACGLILAFVASRRFSNPLRKLNDATRAIAQGDFSVRVPARYKGEMGELATSFNRMAGELDRADELRRNMVADIAHELRTPLSVIRGKLEGVIDGVYPATQEHLTPILEETELLTHLVEDLRLLSLAEAGQLPIEKRPLSIADLLSDTYVNFSPEADDRGITLSVNAGDDLPETQADWRRITQVLGNLMTNALRHTPRGGAIILSAKTSGRFVEIAVQDTGGGVSPEDAAHIFERFWRGEKSRSRAGGGSGLGLAIARQLVELHGGEIGVRCCPSGGAEFWFTLPAG